MQQYAQVVAVYPEVVADLIFVTLLEEDFAEQPAVTLRHLVEDFADFMRHLLVCNSAEHIHVGGWEVALLFVIERIVTGRSAIVLEQYVVAHGIDEGPEAIGLPDLSVAQGGKDTGESFLAHIFDSLWRVQTGTQFELDQFAEIRDEMFLRPEVSCLKTLNVSFIKRLELQGPPLADGGVPASVAPHDSAGTQR